MIVTYNKEQVGDVLMLTLKNSGDAKLAVERKGKVARVFREDKQETVAWNIFDASSFFAIEGKGQVFLTDEQVDRLNQELEKEGCTLEEAHNEAKQRWIWKGKKFYALPSNLITAIRTPLFSWTDKFGILLEPFRAKGTNPNEDVASMVVRRW